VPLVAVCGKVSLASVSLRCLRIPERVSARPFRPRLLASHVS